MVEQFASAVSQEEHAALVKYPGWSYFGGYCWQISGIFRTQNKLNPFQEPVPIVGTYISHTCQPIFSS